MLPCWTGQCALHVVKSPGAGNSKCTHNLYLCKVKYLDQFCPEERSKLILLKQNVIRPTGKIEQEYLQCSKWEAT